MKKMILAFSVLTLVIASCKKDKTDAPVTPTKENLTGAYKVTAASMSSGSGSVDIFNNDNLTEPCERDDIYQLNADNSYGRLDLGTVCSPSNDYTGGTWSLDNSTTLNLDGEIGTIKSWNGKTLVIDYVMSGVTFSSTYVKQ
jgi:hypothetical protein